MPIYCYDGEELALILGGEMKESELISLRNGYDYVVVDAPELPKLKVYLHKKVKTPKEVAEEVCNLPRATFANTEIEAGHDFTTPWSKAFKSKKKGFKK